MVLVVVNGYENMVSLILFIDFVLFGVYYMCLVFKIFCMNCVVFFLSMVGIIVGY